MTAPDARNKVVERLRTDLIGPTDVAEVIQERPSDRYLSGILFPRQMRIAAEEDEELAADRGDDEPGGEDEAVPLANCLKPASMGLSFAVDASGDSEPIIEIEVRAARYQRVEKGEDASANVEWHRHEPKPFKKTLKVDFKEHGPEKLDGVGFPGLALYSRASPLGGFLTVTVIVINETAAAPDRDASELATWFQSKLKVRVGSKTRFVPRDPDKTKRTADDRTAALIYRNSQEFAVGHTCSVSWRIEEKAPLELETEWIPAAIVPAVSADGDRVFGEALATTNTKPFSAAWLASASDEQLLEGLALVPAAWKNWVKREQSRIGALPKDIKPYAAEHEKLWLEGIRRIEAAIETLRKSKVARDAFRLANEAMVLQRKWAKNESDLTWRPFQLAFQLLTLDGILNPQSNDREVADLLWFPTGGGKTEAYLGCIAILLFYRRLDSQAPRDGGGVSVIMRYTLRVLTTQQFERAAAMIAAADLIRSRHQLMAKQDRFRLGLWIGGDVRPKLVADARKPALRSEVMDLKRCPCCGKPVAVSESDPSKFELECTRKKCELATYNPVMPVWTVDEDIYREPPSLVIGTIDKFAQITRNPKTGSLFGLANAVAHRPPDLIIQDELHLISGPLGTVAGLYEVAIDELCANGGSRPKVVGSTATIKMADDQVRQLFMRGLYQFPPPGLDADNSCFAVSLPEEKKPGRLYLGVTTAGRSAKFTLQAVCASLLQSAADPSLNVALEDAYWTLVAYFNSLRELGGAHVLMLDDVPKTVGAYAARRAEKARPLSEPEELTSRRSQREIPEILAGLSESKSSGNARDALLATNMISVGVDIDRLALMVVNGQPKTVAEYIQATSRVGRAKVPGLVVGIFNAAKPRDRSYFESFFGWHATLYRNVEPTSVTPFAPRAVDRALRAVLVAMVRHLIAAMATNPRMAGRRKQIEAICRTIAKRCSKIDPAETLEVEARLAASVDEWEARVAIDKYWDDWDAKRSLLVSAERNAQLTAAGRGPAGPWPAPNSMRSVEPTTAFRLE